MFSVQNSVQLAQSSLKVELLESVISNCFNRVRRVYFSLVNTHKSFKYFHRFKNIVKSLNTHYVTQGYTILTLSLSWTNIGKSTEKNPFYYKQNLMSNLCSF